MLHSMQLFLMITTLQCLEEKIYFKLGLYFLYEAVKVI